MSPSRELRFFGIYNMPFGKISIESDGEFVTGVKLGGGLQRGQLEPDSLTNECANQILEYLSGKRSVFDIPHRACGTQFQEAVWAGIEKIPYSHVVTSSELAESIGMPNAYRQVGSAIRANPIPIVIPAHRVIPNSGYTGKDEKARLRAAFRDLEKRFG